LYAAGGRADEPAAGRGLNPGAGVLRTEPSRGAVMTFPPRRSSRRTLVSQGTD